MQLDGEEQIECWGSFRVGRRGRGRVVARGGDATWAWLWAHHDGYRFLPGRPRHERLIALSADALLVLDRITGTGRHRVRSALHLHPDAPADVSADSFGADLERIAVPLHERWNDEREMQELACEVDAELPWSGGWLVVFSRADAPIEAELHRTGDTLRASCRLPRGPLEVDWNLRSRSETGVTISLHTPEGGSARPEDTGRIPSREDR